MKNFCCILFLFSACSRPAKIEKRRLIASAKLNGQTLNRNYITWEEIQNGGMLEFEMTNKTN
jgi:putative alpha-1,2-mannosidase